MKRVALVTFIGALLAVACTNNNDVKYYIAYDDVDMYTYPADTARVIGTLEGNVGRKKISVTDRTGEWGRVKGRVNREIQEGWVPLNKMVYCGSNNKNDTIDHYVVTAEKIPLYKHPKVNKKDVYGGLKKGDTIAATATSGKWVHIHQIQYSKSGKRKDHYGWVQLSNLQQIEQMSEAMAQDREIEQAMGNDKHSTLKQTSHTIYRYAFMVVGGIAVLLVILLMVSASRRKKVLNLLLLLPIAFLMIIFGLDMKMMTMLFLPIIPLMAYVLAYPLLYTNKTHLFGHLFATLSILLVGFYSFFITDVYTDSGFHFWRLVLCLIVLFACYTLSHYIYKRTERDICPHCGYWAKHPKGSWGITGSDSSHSTRSEDRFVRREEHMDYSTNTKRVTDYYERENYDVETKTSYHARKRTCLNCGREYENHKTTTLTTSTRQ